MNIKNGICFSLFGVLLPIFVFGTGGSVSEAADQEKLQSVLPFDGDISTNLNFFFSFKDDVDPDTLNAHINLLFEKVHEIEGAETRRQWVGNILAKLAQGKTLSPAVKLLLLQRIILNNLPEEDPDSRKQTGEALELLRSLSPPDSAPAISVSFLDKVDENALFRLGDQPYLNYCEVAARIYERIGRPGVARYWRAKASYIDPQVANLPQNIPVEGSRNKDKGYFFLMFLIGGFLFYMWVLITNTVTVGENRLMMALVLPRWSRRYAILAWVVICQLAFSLYAIALKSISGYYVGIYFPLALNIATQLLIWGYFRFFSYFGSLSDNLDGLFRLDGGWIQRNRDRLQSRKLPFILGCIWGMTVASVVISVIPDRIWLLKVILWLYLFFVNFWTGVAVFEIAVLSLAIISLRKFKFKNLLGNQAAVFSIGSMLLRISVVLILYISICLGSFKLSGILGIEVYLAIYLGMSVIGLVAFFFGIPFFIHLKLKNYRDFHLAALCKTLGEKIGEVLRDEYGNIDKAVGINSKFREIMDEINKVPVWPFNFKIISSFLSIIIIPVLMIIFNLVTSTDSILYHTDAFKYILSIFK
jgi:hypothetical protein